MVAPSLLVLGDIRLDYKLVIVQWTLTYLNFFYVYTWIIRTPRFNHYVIKNYIILFCGDHMYDQLAMIAITTNRKWKRVVLSIESKLSVLDSVAKGVSYSELSEKFDIGKSTITSLENNEAKIREFATTLESIYMPSASWKVMRLTKDKELDRALYLWFIQQRGIGMYFTYMNISLI